jgi:RND family efflux transporter MFP subunit
MKENITMNLKILAEKIKILDKITLSIGSLGAALVLFGIGYIILGRTNGYATIAKGETPVAVQAVTVGSKVVDAVVSATGVLTSKNTSVLSSKIMGKIIALTVHEGDYVSQGALLLRIESGEISAQVYQAQAAYNNAKLQYDRIKGLFDEKAATQMEMDQATLGSESAKAGLNAAKAMESYTIVSAPINGRIVEKRINLGEMALPGQPLLKLEDNKHLMLEVTVKEQDLRAVQFGKAVSIRIDAIPGKELKARVGQIVPAADIRTHSFIAKIDIPAEKGLITGMYGRAFFSLGKRETILVPRTAVVELSGITGVYIVSAEGNALFQMVQLGEIQGDYVEATTGLKAGDRVIVSKQDSRIDGRKVVVVQN